MSYEGTKLAPSTGTVASNAITMNALRGVITTEALVAAAGVAYIVTLTNNKISASSRVKAWITGYSGTLGTNGQPILFKDDPGSGTIVFRILNTHPLNALTGTLKIEFEIEN
jgi:hypothetical protein